jgi:probable phosphoglycerate mutase
MSANLLLIRHGQIRANVVGRWHGSTDSPLTALGKRQSERLARRMGQFFPDLAAIYTSPLQRCIKTALAVSRAVGEEVQIDDDLREYGIGELENTHFKSLAEEHDFFKRVQTNRDFAPRGGDSVNTVAARILSALQRIHAAHDEDEHVAIISHGAAMGVALASLLDDDPGGWPNYTVSNCSITELSLSPHPSVEAFNRVEHL